jgi:urease accessory protein
MDRADSVPIAAQLAASCPPREQRCRERGLRAGAGRVAIARVDGASAIVACAAASPLQLLSPSPRGRCAWIIPASHGGGLLAGDDVSLEMDVGDGAVALLSTQAGTKVYRSPGRVAAQRLDARVGRDAVLAVLPHPVSCFTGARYHQSQRLELEPGASVVWLDALSAGRVARGERWAFHEYRSRVEIANANGGAPVLVDALRLVAGEGPPLAERLEGIELVATVVALGPAVARHAAGILAALAAPLDAVPRRGATLGAGGGSSGGAEPVLAAASALGDGVLLRVASRTVEAGLAFLRERLAFVETVVGADPFARTP